MDKETLIVRRKSGHSVKTDLVWNWLMFLGGVAIAGLSVAIDLPGGLFADKLISLALRFLTIAALFSVLAFRANAARFAIEHTSWWELLLAGGFSVYQGVSIWQSFSRVYLRYIAQGEAPSIAQRVYDAVPGPDALKLTLLYGMLLAMVLIACFGFFFLSVCVIRLLKETIRTTVHQLDYPDFEPSLSLGKRMLIGAALACVTALFCFLILNKGQEWGGDYTVYLTQAQQIATGQTEGIDIVWGYGLMLAPIYRLVGYDRVDFSSIIYYKIPATLCLVLFTFVLFLFFSKRFKALYAAALTMIFGLSPVFVTYTNEILTNLPHLLFSTLSILCLYELFQERKLGKQIAYATLAGIFIGYSDLIRVNGIVLVLTLACTHMICLISWLLRKKKFFGGLYQRLPVRHLVVHLIPYIVYFLLTKLVSAQLFQNGSGLGAQTGGMTAGAQSFLSVVQGGALPNITFAWILDSIRYYWEFLSGFLYELTPFGVLSAQVPFLIVPLLVIGLVRSFRKELISVIYLFGMVAMLCLTEFRQGIRYVFPVLPMLVLLFAVGLQSFFDTAARYTQKPKLMSGILRAIAVLACAGFLVGTSYFAVTNLQQHREYDLYSFSEDAKDVYRYIMQKTSKDSVIVFIKPDVITLNTEHAAGAILPTEVDREVYLLITSDGPREQQLTDPEHYGSIENMEKQTGFQFELTYSNPRFDLYRITE